MIRPFTCVCMLLAGASGLYLYQEKHRAHLLEIEIGKTVKQIEAERARISLLRTEWALLNEPERLQELASRHLQQLQPTAPSQYVQLSELDQHLPSPLPPGAPTASGPVDEPASVPVAQGSEAGPGQGPNADAPIAVASVAVPGAPQAGRPEPRPARTAEAVPPARAADRRSAPAAERRSAPAAAPVLMEAVAQAALSSPAPRPERRVAVARRAPERRDAAADRQPPLAPGLSAPVLSAYAAPQSVMGAAPAWRRVAAPQRPVFQQVGAFAPPRTTGEAIARIARGGAVDPSVPAVASALGAARSMMLPPPVPIASAEAATLPRVR